MGGGMSDETTAQPAGWYQDPAGVGRQRWWDGQQWTQGTRLAPPSLVEEPAVVRRRQLVYLACFVLLGAVIVGSMVTAEDSSTTRSANGRDSSATLACYELTELADDFDLLTVSELRQRVRSIHERAQYSDTPGVALAARALLAEVTSQDDAAAAAALRRLVTACSG